MRFELKISRDPCGGRTSRKSRVGTLCSAAAELVCVCVFWDLRFCICAGFIVAVEIQG